jgi:MFS family permease
MVCGVAGNFLQLLLARIGVGVGEATLVPSANSMIGDMFPRERIPFAVSVFTAGSVLGSAIAFVVGGAILSIVEKSGVPLLPFLSGLAPWQQVFVYVGAPGVLLVPALLLLRDRLRRRPATPQTLTDWQAVKDFYRLNRATIVLHHAGFMALSLMGFCFVFWSVSFFTRVHGMQASTASQIFGWIFLLAGPFGGVWAAAVAKRRAARGARDANISAAMLGGGCSSARHRLVWRMDRCRSSHRRKFARRLPACSCSSSPSACCWGRRLPGFLISMFFRRRRAYGIHSSRSRRPVG